MIFPAVCCLPKIHKQIQFRSVYRCHCSFQWHGWCVITLTWTRSPGFHWIIFLLFLVVSYDVTSARDMLLLASCQDEQKKWVTHLVKKIPKTPPSTFVRASPRTLSTRSSANQSFRKAVKNTSGKTRWEISYKNYRSSWLKKVSVDKSYFIWNCEIIPQLWLLNCWSKSCLKAQRKEQNSPVVMVNLSILHIWKGTMEVVPGLPVPGRELVAFFPV